MMVEPDWWFSPVEYKRYQNLTGVSPMKFPKVAPKRMYEWDELHRYLKTTNPNVMVTDDKNLLRLLRPKSHKFPVFDDAPKSIAENILKVVPHFSLQTPEEKPLSSKADVTIDSDVDEEESGPFTNDQNPALHKIRFTTQAPFIEPSLTNLNLSKVKRFQDDIQEEDETIEYMKDFHPQITIEGLYETTSSDDLLDSRILRKPPSPKQQHSDEELLCAYESQDRHFPIMENQETEKFYGILAIANEPDSERIGEPSDHGQEPEGKSGTTNSDTPSVSNGSKEASSSNSSSETSTETSNSSSKNENRSEDVTHPDTNTNANLDDVIRVNYDYGTPQSYHSSTIGSLPATPEHLEVPPPIQGESDGEDEKEKDIEEEEEAKHTVDATGHDILPPISDSDSSTSSSNYTNTRKRQHSQDDCQGTTTDTKHQKMD